MRFERHSFFADFTQRSEGIQIRTSRRKFDGFDAHCFDGQLKGLAEFRVAIMDQVPGRGQKADIRHGHIPGHLGHPLLVGIWRDAGNMDPPRSQVHEEQNVVGDEPRFRPHLSGEEIRRREHIHVRTDKLLPRRGVLTVWRRRYTVAFQITPGGFKRPGETKGRSLNWPRKERASFLTARVLGTGDEGIRRLLINRSPGSQLGPVFSSHCDQAES